MSQQYIPADQGMSPSSRDIGPSYFARPRAVAYLPFPRDACAGTYLCWEPVWHIQLWIHTFSALWATPPAVLLHCRTFQTAEDEVQRLQGTLMAMDQVIFAG